MTYTVRDEAFYRIETFSTLKAALAFTFNVQATIILKCPAPLHYVIKSSGRTYHITENA